MGFCMDHADLPYQRWDEVERLHERNDVGWYTLNPFTPLAVVPG